MDIIDIHVHTQAVPDYDEAARRLVDHMRMHGISRMILSDLGDGWRPFPDSRTVRIANDRVEKLCARVPNSLSFLVYLNPQLPDWREEFLRHRETAVGVKLWISLRREGDSSLENSIEVLQTAARYGLPVLIHTFDCTDGLAFGSIGIDGLIELAERVPNCTIVAAHACGNWRRAIDNAASFPANVFFDISGSYPERTMVSRLVSRFGANRILFGSDAPGRSWGSQLHKVMEAGLSETDRDAVLRKNAETIFRLAPPAETVPEPCLPRHEMADSREDHFCFAGRSPWFDHHVSVSNLANFARRNGVTCAYAASLDALGAASVPDANESWLAETASYRMIRPLAVVDLRDAGRSLRQLERMDRFAGVWISPYLHHYRLDAEDFRQFFERCARCGIPVWINVALSDDRFRWRGLSTRKVSEREIADFFRAAPRNRYVIQGAENHSQLDRLLPEYVRLEYSRLSDGEYSAEDFSGDLRRLCRGSEYPFRDYSAVDDVLLGKI